MQFGATGLSCRSFSDGSLSIWGGVYREDVGLMMFM